MKGLRDEQVSVLERCVTLASFEYLVKSAMLILRKASTDDLSLTH